MLPFQFTCLSKTVMLCAFVSIDCIVKENVACDELNVVVFSFYVCHQTYC